MTVTLYESPDHPAKHDDGVALGPERTVLLEKPRAALVLQLQTVFTIAFGTRTRVLPSPIALPPAAVSPLLPR